MHFVSDKWITPSIKDCEREKRDTAPAAYAITGPSQKRPQNWLLAMRNPFFKQSLITFLLDAWQSDEMSTILEGKELFANDEDHCYKFSSEGGVVTRSEDRNLFSMHEEADNRMFFHISLLQEEQNVIVRTIDTDCLVIALGCRPFISSNVRIWLEVGLQSNNTLRYISVDQLYLTIGASMCKALPAYHAFTGCDYTSSFSRKGKVAPLKKLEKNAECQTALGLLSEVETDGDVEQFLPQISKFVCEMYGKRHLKSTDDARMDIFMSKYELKREDQLISSVQKLDGSMLPPCSQVLKNKVLRTSYVAKLWMSAVSPHPPCASPTEFGWKLEDNRFRVVWFNGKSAPQSLDVMREEFQSDDGKS